MSDTPAARLARIKVQHPAWRIYRVDGGYMATRGTPGSPEEETVTAASPAQLECELPAADPPRATGARPTPLGELLCLSGSVRARPGP